MAAAPLVRRAKGDCAYCDYSCAMGDCCELRCFNPVHNWQVGWGKPVAKLTADDLPVGQPVAFTLPHQQSNAKNMILIIPDWLGGYDKDFRGYAIYLDYRCVDAYGAHARTALGGPCRQANERDWLCDAPVAAGPCCVRPAGSRRAFTTRR